MFNFAGFGVQKKRNIHIIACYGINAHNPAIEHKVVKDNRITLEEAMLTVRLPISDFCGILGKICELVYEQLRNGAQVVLIPDGPKPLIMAMSLVPAVVGFANVTCLHISHNNALFSQVRVQARKGEIYGFQVERKQL